MEETSVSASFPTLTGGNSVPNFTDPPVLNPKSPADYNIYQIAKDMLKYQIFVLVSIGVPANCLNMAVLLRKNMRNSPSSVHFFSLAVFDTMALCTYLISMLSRLYYPEMISKWFCKTLFFVQSFSSQSSAWSVVTMTSERLVVVMFPLKAARWCSVRNARLAILSYVTLVIGFNLQYFWTGISFRTFCILDQVKFGSFLNDWSYADSTFTVYMPVASVLVLNFLIIRQTRLASSKQKAMTSSEDSAKAVGSGGANKEAEKRAAKQARQITTMLVTVSITFFLLTTPYGVYFILFQIWTKKSDPWLYALSAFLQQICVGLFLINHSLNFFLYCVTGRKFRNELFTMLGCARTKRGRGAHAPKISMAGTTSTSSVVASVSSSQVTVQTKY